MEINSYRRCRKLVDVRLKPLNAYKPTDFRRVLLARKMKTLREYSMSTRRSIRVRPKEYIKRCALSVGTQYAGSNIDALRLAIHDLGFNEITNEQDRDITWNGAYFFKNDRRRDGFVNKYPGMHCLLTKINLFKCLELQRLLYPEIYNFYPPTWFLPCQYDQWSEYVLKQIPGCTTYIIKPSGGTQGKGIYLVQSPREYCDHQVQLALDNSQHNNLIPRSREPPACLGGDNLGFLPAKEVAQRYEDQPALVGGYKADLRLYVVLESLSPLRFHVYRDGLVRLASQRYEPPDSDNLQNNKMHLTNYSINKFPDAHGAEDSASGDLDEEDGELDYSSGERPPIWQCKRRLHNFLRPRPSNLNGERWKLNARIFWNRVDDLVRNTMFTLVPYLRVAYWAECQRTPNKLGKEPPKAFQILGFDLLLVEPDFRPVLLEVNSSPSLRIDCMKPLVRFSATLAGMANSPKYAAFARSRVDETVKAGLLKATLSLIGCRLIYERLLVDSSEDKATAFLVTCGYKTPSVALNETDTGDGEAVMTKKTDEKKNSPRESDGLSNMSGRYRKTTRRTSLPATLSSHWMCERISQIYDDVSTTKLKASPPLSVSDVDMGKRASFSPSMPAFRRSTLSSIYGRQSVSEKLSNFFLDGRKTPSCRASRNLLHCIYAEDDVYFPVVPCYFEEDDDDLEVDHEDEHTEKESDTSTYPHTFPEFTPSKLAKIHSPAGDMKSLSKSASEEAELTMEVELVTEKQRKTENAETHEAAESTAPNVSSDSNKPSQIDKREQHLKSLKLAFDNLRQVDRLADIFITILNERRVVEQSKMQHSQQNNSPPFYPYQIYTDLNGRTLSSNVTHRMDCTLGVEVPVPRMDPSGFRSFIIKCHLRYLGMNTQELDMLYLKHRLFCYRVFEPECPEADLGISFSGFVELCLLLAKNLFLPPEYKPESGGKHEVSSEVLRSAFTAFINHCMEGFRARITNPSSSGHDSRRSAKR